MPAACHPAGPTGSSQFHHGLPRDVVVDEEGTAQFLVRVPHHKVLGGLLTQKVKSIGIPEQRRRQR